MMNDLDARPEPDELDDREFEEALRAQTRRRWMLAGGLLVVLIIACAVPWRESVSASGRVAPARWAKVRSEVPGVVREVRRRSGDVVQEGDVIAVLDSEEQRDALEAARLALTREKQKLADLELRLRENRILRDGADAAVDEAERRAHAAERIEDARLAALDPAAAAVLDAVRTFTLKARGQLALDGRHVAPLGAEPLLQAAEAAIGAYGERADDVAQHLGSVAGNDSGRELRERLESVRFAFALAESSMHEIALKHEFVRRGLLAPVELRELVSQLERESRDLSQTFGALAGTARAWKGSPAQRREWVRTAEERRQILANETDRFEAERETVESGIAQAELLVRAAERNEGKTSIHAPIGGVLSESALAELDGIGANAAVGVVEDTDRLVLKVRAADGDWGRVAEGQTATADVGGRMVDGTVTWKVPRAGQEVRDQEWNVLIQVDGDVEGIQPGEKVDAAVAVGRRSWLGRLVRRDASDPPPPTGVAFVNDPTEQRASGSPGELAALRPGGTATNLAEPARKD